MADINIKSDHILFTGNSPVEADLYNLTTDNHRITYDIQSMIEYMYFVSEILDIKGYDEFKYMTEEDRENYKKTIIRDRKIDDVLR